MLIIFFIFFDDVVDDFVTVYRRASTSLSQVRVYAGIAKVGILLQRVRVIVIDARKDTIGQF
jgi:hypothetical protein